MGWKKEWDRQKAEYTEETMPSEMPREQAYRVSLRGEFPTVHELEAREWKKQTILGKKFSFVMGELLDSSMREAKVALKHRYWGRNNPERGRLGKTRIDREWRPCTEWNVHQWRQARMQHQPPGLGPALQWHMGYKEQHKGLFCIHSPRGIYIYIFQNALTKHSFGESVLLRTLLSGYQVSG